MWTASQSQGQPSKARKNQAKGKRPRRFFPANASTTSGRATRRRVGFEAGQLYPKTGVQAARGSAEWHFVLVGF